MLKLSNLESIGKPVYKFQNNHSVDFDGVDDFIQLDEPISYTQHTISTWVKISDTSDVKTIIDARDASDDGIRIRTDANEQIIYEVNTSDIFTSDSFVDVWTHIVATYDGTTQKLYINGSLVSSATTSQTINTTTNAKIGARNFSTRANEFAGKIDELAIFDRALTADEVTAIFRIKYGANLVLNGNFDELGSELVTNGDFATDSNWTKSDGATISGGKANIEGDGSTFVYINQSNIFTSSGSTYKVTADVVITSGLGLKFQDGATNENIGVATTSGSYTFYFTAGSNSTLVIGRRTGGTAFESSVDNVSVKQVDPNDRWTLGTGWSYGDGVASCDGTDGVNLSQSGVIENLKTYKINFTVNLTSGTLLLRAGLSYVTDLTITTSGSYETIVVSDGTNLIFRSGSFVGSVTNVMVEQQKYVASNLKLNSGNYKSADPVIVSTKSVDFDGTDDYLEVTKKDFLGTSDFTISMWIKPDTVTADNYFMGQYTDDNNRWYIRVRGSDSVIQFFSKNSGNQVVSVLGGTPIANQWNHIVVTADRDDVSKLYLNGVLVNTNSETGASLTFTGNLEIGAFRLFGGYFNGTIDEFGIFSSALSSDQVGELYNQGVPSNLSTHSANANLTGYWKMGDGTLDESPLIADQTNATLGSDVITNGDFNGNADNWTLQNAEYQAGSNNVILTKPSSGNSVIFQTGLSFEEGQILRYKFKFVSFTGSPFIRIDGFSGSNPLNTSTTFAASDGDVDTYIRTDRAGSSVFLYIVGGNEGDTVVIDDVSVQIVQGNPGIMQNTPTIVTDAPLTKIRNYYRMGDGILDTHPFICDMVEPSLQDNVLTGNSTTFDTGIGDWITYNGGQLSHNNTLKALEVTLLSSESGARINTNELIAGGQTGKLLKVSADIWRGTTTDTTFKIFIGGIQDQITITDTQTNYVTYLTPSSDSLLTIYRAGSGNAGTYYIDNVKVEEVNGVPGLMTNMTEADITNDVPS